MEDGQDGDETQLTGHRVLGEELVADPDLLDRSRSLASLDRGAGSEAGVPGPGPVERVRDEGTQRGFERALLSFEGVPFLIREPRLPLRGSLAQVGRGHCVQHGSSAVVDFADIVVDHFKSANVVVELLLADVEHRLDAVEGLGDPQVSGGGHGCGVDGPVVDPRSVIRLARLRQDRSGRAGGQPEVAVAVGIVRHGVVEDPLGHSSEQVGADAINAVDVVSLPFHEEFSRRSRTTDRADLILDRGPQEPNQVVEDLAGISPFQGLGGRSPGLLGPAVDGQGPRAREAAGASIWPSSCTATSWRAASPPAKTMPMAGTARGSSTFAKRSSASAFRALSPSHARHLLRSGFQC